MTPLREAIVLPGMLLTVALLGGVRVAQSVTLMPPSLTALVLAMLLVGTLIRGGVLAPLALVNGSRAPLENLSGAAVLLALFAATAQVINLLLPERGLLHAAFAIFLFCQIAGMQASGANRAGLLRGLLVLFGALFILRFIVVEALYAPTGGLLQRVLTTLMSGATLGGIAYDPNAPVTGYVAFFTIVLYVSALVLLPRATAPGALVRVGAGSSGLPTALLVILAVWSTGCRAPASEPEDDRKAQTPPAQQRSSTDLVSAEQRADAWRRAQVWRQPETPVLQARLNANPSGPAAFKPSDEVRCRLVIKAMGGTTPKFDCETPDGEVIRVKYGRGNPELYSEVATTRLLTALGFGADRMYTVKRVKCAGCGTFPFHSLRCLSDTGLERGCFPGGIDYADSTDFDDAVVERRLEGRRIEASADQGWAWYELDRVSEKAGGAPRAHVDALALLAVVIAHWDNKAENQRLICLPGGDTPDGGCSRPFALIQDVGASFGPVKLDLPNWRALPVWADARSCRVTMKNLPWGGATFPERQISEEGRTFLLSLLEQLSEAQLIELFEGAGIANSEGVTAEGRQPAAWAAGFLDKVRQIRQGGPCPPVKADGAKS